MDQDFLSAYTVEALSAVDSVTSNYEGNYVKLLEASFSYSAIDHSTPTPLPGRVISTFPADVRFPLKRGR